MELTRNGHRRIVITGIGAITPMGQYPTFWENLKAGKSGIKRLDHLDLTHIKVHIGSYIYDFDPTPFVEKKEIRRTARCSQLSMSATHLMLQDAGLTEADLERDSERSGVVVGTGLGGIEVAMEAAHEFRAEIRTRPSPFVLTQGLSNMQAHYVSRETKAVGPIWPVTTACAAGTQAIVQASDLIRNGRVDRVFAGGVDSLIQEYAIAGFDSMGALASGFNDNPEAASRPFEKDRNGFVYGEGAAFMVVETLEKALERDAHIYAEVLGGASSSDAFHIAALDPEGQGPMRSMQWALEDAGVNIDDIDYINAHGTSTPVNDRIETLAIKKLFGEQAYQIPISSTKSMMGHCQGASGAIEAVASIQTINEGIIHPTVNYQTPDPECDLDYVPNEAREVEVNMVLSNNFGLGGQNASLVLAKI